MTALKVSETQFSQTIEDLLTRFGWRWFHSRPSRLQNGEWRTAYSGADGAPDYPIVLRRDRSLMIELKADDGTLTPEQYFWLEAGHKAGLEVYLWQPKDDINEIAKILR